MRIHECKKCQGFCSLVLFIYLASESELDTSAGPLETAKTRSSTRSSKAKGDPCTKGVLVKTNGRCGMCYIVDCFETWLVKFCLPLVLHWL